MPLHDFFFITWFSYRLFIPDCTVRIYGFERRLGIRFLGGVLEVAGEEMGEVRKGAILLGVVIFQEFL